MLIKSISVCNFGTISRYETTFRSGFHEIQISAAPELAAALELVLRNHTRNVPKRWIQDDTKIEAVMQTKQTDYRVVLTPNRKRKEKRSKCFLRRQSEYLFCIETLRRKRKKKICQ